MIEFIRVNKKLALTLLLSIIFFLKKGIDYALIGSFIPLLISSGLLVVLAISIKTTKISFIRIVRIWAIILILWSISRIVISIVHLTIKPFDGSFHLTQQFNGYALVFSVLMLVLSIFMFRSSSRKRIKDWL